MLYYIIHNAFTKNGVLKNGRKYILHHRNVCVCVLGGIPDLLLTHYLFSFLFIFWGGVMLQLQNNIKRYTNIKNKMKKVCFLALFKKLPFKSIKYNNQNCMKFFLNYSDTFYILKIKLVFWLLLYLRILSILYWMGVFISICFEIKKNLCMKLLKGISKTGCICCI